MHYRFSETSPNLEQFTALFSDVKIPMRKYVIGLRPEQQTKIKDEIQEYYFNRGFGLKLIARNVLGTTYTNVRTIFSALGLEFRKGSNVKTKNLSNIRREKALFESQNGVGFGDPKIKYYATKTARGVQGYYYNESTNEYVWLRSTWEYIYAKFLNKIGANWKTEQHYFVLSDNTRYCPDFYIYDDNWELESIIEVKGYFDCRAYKCELLKQDHFSESNISIILITDIKKYIENTTDYYKELETWKLLRKSKEFLLDESNQ